MRCVDAAVFGDDEELTTQAVADAVVQTISTDIKIDLGGVEVFLAMLQDPEHWEDDWRELGIELDDLDAFLGSLILVPDA